jgi:NADH/F420H2 dehydrogenase subunit C
MQRKPLRRQKPRPKLKPWRRRAPRRLLKKRLNRLGSGTRNLRRRGTQLPDLILEVERSGLCEVCASLRHQHGFGLLVDICGADYPQREEERFEVVYHVYSLETNRRVRLKVRVPEGEEVPSVISVWRGADWCEREIYDMFGIVFSDHPDMTRILTWEGFNGHPLRKDFPVEGIDTGAAIYPERYEVDAGPIAGTGTGWKLPKPESEDELQSETKGEQK